MIAVIFEVFPSASGKEEYLKIAAQLKHLLSEQPGLISLERFQSLTDEGKLLSLSFWQDEAAITSWRNQIEHRWAQAQGRDSLFKNYRIRVANVVRDYGQTERDQAPTDSKTAFV